MRDGRLDVAPVTGVAEAFEADRGFLWSLAYRLTGNAADADDVVQETFVRALQHPPADTSEPWRPWLVRVAVNLGRDLLRRRRRREAAGVWLPSPLETGDAASLAEEPAARFDLTESASLAFLLALEALSPAQRAVVLLRDVFDHSVRETAEALAMSEANVKTTHARARRALRPYEDARQRPTRRVQESTRAALESLMRALQQGDASSVGALLAADVRSLSDGGGVYFASRRPVEGREAVARLYLGLGSKAGRVEAVRLRMVGGLPALDVTMTGGPAGWAPRVLMQVQLDAQGHVARIYALMAPAKLAALA
jgi:RNA polymerase sigma-70 factor (ECF subfamily)